MSGLAFSGFDLYNVCMTHLVKNRMKTSSRMANIDSFIKLGRDNKNKQTTIKLRDRIR